MNENLRHNINLVIPGLNFLGDQNSSAKSVVDRTKWVMQTAIDRIETLEAALDDALQYVSRADWHYLKPETIQAMEDRAHD
jgi:hypothetical protein